MKVLLITYILLLQQLNCYYQNMFAYFDTQDCPKGWTKVEGGFYLIGSANKKQNIQNNGKGSFTYITKDYHYGDTIGSMKTILEVDNIPSHEHTYLKPNEAGFFKIGGGDGYLVNNYTPQQTTPTGGNQPFDITPESYVATLCKYTDPSVNIDQLLLINKQQEDQIKQLNSTVQILTQNFNPNQNQQQDDQIKQLNSTVQILIQNFIPNQNQQQDDQIKQLNSKVQNLIQNQNTNTINQGQHQANEENNQTSDAKIGMIFGIISLILSILIISFLLVQNRNLKKNIQLKYEDNKENTKKPNDVENQIKSKEKNDVENQIKNQEKNDAKIQINNEEVNDIIIQINNSEKSDAENQFQEPETHGRKEKS